MKKRNQKRQMLIKLFSLAIFAFICVFTFLSSSGTDSSFAQTASVGIMAGAMVFSFPKELGLTEKEEGAFKTIAEALNSEMEKREKGYLTETKFQESITEKFNQFLKDNPLDAKKIEELEKTLTQHGITLTGLKETGGKKEKRNIFTELKEQFEANKEAIQATLKGGTYRITLKETSAASVYSTDFSSGSFIGHRETLVEGTQPNEFSPITLIQTMYGGQGSNPLSWLERSVKSGAAAGILETEESPDINFEWTEAEMNMRIISALTVVSKRVVNNYPMLEQEIRGELVLALMNELNRQIINGDGLTKEIKGLMEYASDLVTTSYANSIPSANNWDVLLLAWKQSRKAFKGSRPNAILVSIGNGVDMDLTKDKNDNYVFPAFMVNQDKSLKGVKIIESDDIADGEFLVGDFSKCLFNFVENMVIEIGWMDDQFGKRQFSILAEVTGMQRVKAQFKAGFVKGVFSTAIAAITKQEPAN